MHTILASSVESCLKLAPLGCHQSKLVSSPRPVNCGSRVGVKNRRRPATTGIPYCSAPPKLSRRSSFLLPRASLSAGDATPDRDDVNSSTSTSTSSSSSSSSSSDDSDSGSNYSFLPSRKLKSSAGSKGTEAQKSPAQTALERALAYKKSKGAVSGQKPAGGKGLPPTPPDKLPQVEIVAGRAFDKKSDVSTSRNASSSSPGMPEVASSPKNVEEQQQVGPSTDRQVRDTTSIQEKNVPSGGVGEPIQESKDVVTPASQRESAVTNDVVVPQSALEKAQAYKKKQVEGMVAAVQGQGSSTPAEAASAEEPDKYLEVEIHTRDGIIKRKTLKPEAAFSRVKDLKRTGVSQMDFAGLGFADKKTSNTPAGLMKGLEVAAPSVRPEVEIITRQGEQPGNQGNDSLYKPKVSSWGMFPRPSDISKTYGGGRTIRPGEKLETEEEKVIREARTKKLLEDYRQRMGLDIDPQTRAQHQKAIKRGESLMEEGSMREASSVFQGVINQVPFQSELYGLAALQHSVCLEAIGRSADAKLQYEKLISHPYAAVRKQAKQLLFGFQAMDKLKVTTNYRWDDSLYKQYFSAFSNGYNTSYRADEASEDSLLLKTLPYLILVLPVIVIVSLALVKGLS